MKRFFKYLSGTVVAIIGLLLLVVFLLYLPPIQNFLRIKAVDYVSQHYGWNVRVGHFHLGFPCELTLKDVYAGRTMSDTLLSAESIHIDAGIGGIFHREISIDDLALRRAVFHLSNDTSGLNLRVAVGEINLRAKRVAFTKKLVEIQNISLADGSVSLLTANQLSVDSTVVKPFDWTFLVQQIVFCRVDYRMISNFLPELSAGVTMGNIVGGKVNLQLQTVDVDSVSLQEGWCKMRTASVRPVSPSTAVDSMKSFPWTVRAGSVHLENSAFSLKNNGKDRTNLIVGGIGIQVDSIYNRGTVVRATLKDLQAVQQKGIQITAMRAGVSLDTAITDLQGVYLQTPYSRIRLTARMDTSVQYLMKQIPLLVTMQGELGFSDVSLFYPEIPPEIRNKAMQIDLACAITGDSVEVGQLLFSLPDYFHLTATGKLSSFCDLKMMRGFFNLRGDFPDATFVNAFLKKKRISIPRNLSLMADVTAEKGVWTTDLRLACGKGLLTLDATYQIGQESYRGDLSLTDFPLDRFLPSDSLGIATAGITFAGRGYQWRSAKTEISADVRRFTYLRHLYQDIALQASLDNTHLRGVCTSLDSAAALDLIVRGDSLEKDYQLELSGHIRNVDLKALNVMQQELTVGAAINLNAVIGPDEKYLFRARFDSLKMRNAQQIYTLGNIAMDMNSDLKKTQLQLITGDLKLAFQADTSLFGFTGSVGKVAEVVRQQIITRNVNMEIVRQDLPLFNLQMLGGQENIVAHFLKVRNIGFSRLALDVVSRQRTGLRVSVLANAPYFKTVRLDSLQFGAWQTGESLVYSIDVGSSATAWKGLFNINMTGRMQGDHSRFELKQKDAEGKIGFDLGVNLRMRDSAVSVSFFPMTPILGYSRWIVNADNYVTVGKDWKVNANLRMAYLNKLINLQSLPDGEGQKDRLQVELDGIDLHTLSKTTPFLPDLGGILNTNLLLYSKGDRLGANGNIQIKNMEYQEQHIGTVDLALQYVLGNRNIDHSIEFELKIDSMHRALAKGSFSTSEINRNVAIDVDISSFPLYIANAFIPNHLMKLDGELAGVMRFRGTLDKPLLNGELAFHQGKADVVMLGTTFAIDTARLLVRDGKIQFRQYRFTAPNNSSLLVNGDVYLTPFSRMNMDLAVTAANFEVVNVKKNPTSLIYGKAYANVNAHIGGAFSSLNLTGNINLLNRTAITYTLRTADALAVDRSADLVRFVSFRDTILNEKDGLTNRIKFNSFMMKMLVEIGNQVSVAVDLSENGNDNISIQGGGNLILTMLPESGMTLSGKYILTGGTVVYNVPIAGKKQFSISNGSFVEWTGNVLNPTLNISASEQVKAIVEDGDRNRLVAFESIIRIQNSLSRPDISFDLSAPSDMVIQNQLATFSQEERTRQALNLLIYNTYTAPGAAKSNTGGNMANNALYSFVENELNKYTGKAGLTFGVDSYNTDENTTRTDYTYQFSKQLFNDRVRVKVGGRISTDNNDAQSNTLEDNLVDDISIEYIFAKNRNLYLKVFRHSNYESVLDGEVTQTGVGIVWRKNFRKFKDLFKKNDE
ncbi:MAG: translocation/assembly module TamB domain-containing protein [Odoribacter sp.]